MEEPSRESRTKLLQVLTPLFARRDYSEPELRAKLAALLTESEIEDALELARGKRWLTSDEDRVQRLVESLHQKKKGALFIANHLRVKGLPEPSPNRQLEIRKAQELVDSKLARSTQLDYESKLKLRRFLTSRGFETEVIDQVLGGPMDSAPDFE